MISLGADTSLLIRAMRQGLSVRAKTLASGTTQANAEGKQNAPAG
jgi:hypothetical protein